MRSCTATRAQTTKNKCNFESKLRNKIREMEIGRGDERLGTYKCECVNVCGRNARSCSRREKDNGRAVLDVRAFGSGRVRSTWLREFQSNFQVKLALRFLARRKQPTLKTRELNIWIERRREVGCRGRNRRVREEQ